MSVRDEISSLTAQGLTRTEVARLLGVSVPRVSQIVNEPRHQAGVPVRPMRCGACEELGHNRRTCTVVRWRGKAPGYIASNAGYQANRAAGLCDSCGRSSKRFVYCKRCRDRRRTRPSRQWKHRRLRERGRGGKRGASR